MGYANPQDLKSCNDIVKVCFAIWDWLPYHFQAHIIMRVSNDVPFDERDCHVPYFKTGHTPRVYPASAVEVVRFFWLSDQALLLTQGKKHRTVGVSGDGDHMVVSCPFYNTFFHLIPFSDLLSRACWVSKPEQILERLPDVTYAKPAEWNKGVVDEISLVTVEEKNLIA